MNKALRTATWVTGLAGIGALAWASLIERNQFTLREVTVPVLAPGQDSLAILHISDMHFTPAQRRKAGWVRSLAELKPDLVINTGDNLAHVGALPIVLDALEPLLDFPGAFVFGSNDYYAPSLKNPARYLLADSRVETAADGVVLPSAELAAAFTVRGWKDLTNRRSVVVADGRRISLVGVDDPHLNLDRFPQRGPYDVVGSAPVRSGDAPDTTLRPTLDLRLGVAHAPYLRVLDEMAEDGAELIIAGHTHGGQLCVPGYGALVTNCDLDRSRAKGLHGWPGPRPDEEDGDGSVWLHVSAGLGTSPFAPVRFACPPEATLMTLVPMGEG